MHAESPGLLATSPAGRIVYLCQWTGASGGIQVLYEHVRLLRLAGQRALLGADGPFRRCTWFANAPAMTPGVDDCLASLGPDDVLVVPEFCVGAAQLATVAARRVAFVQNPSLLRASLDGYCGAMVPAQRLVPWLLRTTDFAGPIAVVPGFLHAELIHPQRSFRRTRPRVLLIDRADKHRGEPTRLRELLHRRADLDLTYVNRPLPRSEFVALFRDHDVYLHASHPEGFPISILEAFGAGCLVVGFAGIGGLEFMQDGANCFVVADGDVAGVVAMLTQVMQRPHAELDAILHRARRTAAAFPERGTADALAHLCKPKAGSNPS